MKWKCYVVEELKVDFNETGFLLPFTQRYLSAAASISAQGFIDLRGCYHGEKGPQGGTLAF